MDEDKAAKQELLDCCHLNVICTESHVLHDEMRFDLVSSCPQIQGTMFTIEYYDAFDCHVLLVLLNSFE